MTPEGNPVRPLASGQTRWQVPSSGVLKCIYKAELSACSNASSFLQSDFWGAFKEKFGWEALAFNVEWGSGIEDPGTDYASSRDEFEVKSLLVLRRSIAAGCFGSRGFSLAYIPWGPELPSDLSADFSSNDEIRGAALQELALALKAHLKRDTIFIRLIPPGIKKGPMRPRRTYRIPLSGPARTYNPRTRFLWILPSHRKSSWPR